MCDSRGQLIVVSGPSGVGKTTITNQLVEQLGATFSVSMTTRPITAADTEGEDYFFVDEARFKAAIDRGELLEWAKVFDNYYGTPKAFVDQKLAAGQDVILEIDVVGAIAIKKQRPDALMVFVLPPSEQELLRRLRARAREGEDVIQKRFAEAQREIKQAQDSDAYDHFIVNHVLADAIDQAVNIVREHKASN